MEILEKYEPVIGLEVHIQLLTVSKAFCGDSTAFGAPPNSQTGTISLAHPGTLPRPNAEQVRMAIKLGLALDCEISSRSWFDRKHYFYADLPKGFQTTQNENPICKGGRLTFPVAGGQKTIRLHHIHMEEDAGKSLHELHREYSYIDLNRAGVPLLELVTEPDFRSPEEVYQFINELRRLVRYLEICDGNMEEGSLRCDCNVSVREKGENRLNSRCEIKNLNSARFARRAVEYEFQRQAGLMEEGKIIEQETREFLVDEGITVSLRSKEDAHDYRYFPEPDILPIVVKTTDLKQIGASLPMLPTGFRDIFLTRFELTPADVEILIEDREIAAMTLKFLEKYVQLPARLVSSFLVNKWIPAKESGTIPDELSDDHIADFLELIDSGKLSTSLAYQKLWPELIRRVRPVESICAELNLDQTSDSDSLEELARAVIADNPQQVAQYRKGKKGLMTFFMGQMMRLSGGKAHPELSRQILEKIL